MREIKFEQLSKLKEFENHGDELIWRPFIVDEFMGFTIFRIRATEGENGQAVLKFTEEYVMSGHEREVETRDKKYIAEMEKDLDELLKTL
jgi:hypothetical protein